MVIALSVFCAFLLATCGLLVCLLLWFREPEPLPERNNRFRVQTMQASAKWHRERIEAMAEEAVQIFGYADQPGSVQADICREVIECGRSIDDCEQRLLEIEERLRYADND